MYVTVTLELSVLAQTEGDTGYDYNDAYDDDYDDNSGKMVYNGTLLAKYPCGPVS